MRNLDKYLAQWRGNKMSYAGHDCARFVEGWLGRKFPAWQTQAQALRVIRKHYGVDRVADALTCELGKDAEIEVYLAKPGDIVALDNAPFDCLGICLGRESVFLGETGLVRRKTRQAFRAWRKC